MAISSGGFCRPLREIAPAASRQIKGAVPARGLALEPELAPLKRAAPVVDVVEEGQRTDPIPEGQREIAQS